MCEKCVKRLEAMGVQLPSELKAMFAPGAGPDAAIKAATALNDSLSLLWDREGKRISFDEWQALAARGEEYRRVAETTLSDGKWVSTVWIGMTRPPFDGTPKGIFETLVFGFIDKDAGAVGERLDARVTNTLAEARAAHEELARTWEFNAQVANAPEGKLALEKAIKLWDEMNPGADKVGLA